MNPQRMGGWCLTFTGKRFWPLSPAVEDICIQDIAHALAHVCRFGGHCRQFYSVAQHSLHVSRLVSPPRALAGLLHDATEAYLGDMVRPLKRSMPDYRRAEHDLWAVIARRFGVPVELPLEIKQADNVALMTERRDLLVPSPHSWDSDGTDCAPDSEKIVPLPPSVARRRFLQRFSNLSRTKNT